MAQELLQFEVPPMKVLREAVTALRARRPAARRAGVNHGDLAD